MAKFAVILPAAGRSQRFGHEGYKKPFVPLQGRALWLHAAERFLHRPDVVQLLVAVAREDREFFQMKFGANVAIWGVTVVEGGTQRSDSVRAALEHLAPEADHVAIHDAARPCLADAWIDQVFQEAVKSGAALLAVPVTATVKRSCDGRIVAETVSREGLWEAQTPQAFRRDLIERAYAAGPHADATDDAQLVERLGASVTIVPGSSLNLKVTTRNDVTLAEAALRVLPKPRHSSGSGNPLDDLWR